MAEEQSSGRRWVVEPPPATGEVSLYMACGDGVELNADQEAALGALLRTLEASDAEVVGLTASCPTHNMCGLKCGKVFCSLECVPLTRAAAIGAPLLGWSLTGSFNPSIG